MRDAEGRNPRDALRHSQARAQARLRVDMVLPTGARKVEPQTGHHFRDARGTPNHVAIDAAREVYPRWLRSDLLPEAIFFGFDVARARVCARAQAHSFAHAVTRFESQPRRSVAQFAARAGRPFLRVQHMV